MLFWGAGWLNGYAQSHFSEGILRYTLTVLPAKSGATPRQAGTYHVTLKGSQIRRDLLTDSAHQTTVLCNNRTGITTMLQIKAGNRYAITFSPVAWQERTARYQKYQMEPIRQGSKDTPGGPCQPYLVRYADGRQARLCVSTQLLAEANVFERFPDLKTIPVSFDLFLRSGAQVHFELQEAVVQPVPESAFEVPAGYTRLDPASLPAADEP